MDRVRANSSKSNNAGDAPAPSPGGGFILLQGGEEEETPNDDVHIRSVSGFGACTCVA